MDTIILTVFCAVVSGLGGLVAKSIREIAEAKTDNKFALELADAMADAVEATSQTYVDDLKTQGAFDEAAQKEAIKRAGAACLLLLSEKAKKWLNEITDDVNAYLETKIEAEVRRQKRIAA